MARRRAAATFSDQLREILRAELAAGPGTAYELAKDAGVDRSVLSRFLAGKRTMTLETADRLAECLKLRIVGRGR